MITPNGRVLRSLRSASPHVLRLDAFKLFDVL